MANVIHPTKTESGHPKTVRSYVSIKDVAYAEYTDENGIVRRGIIFYLGKSADGTPTAVFAVSPQDMEKLHRPPAFVEERAAFEYESRREVPVPVAGGPDIEID